MARARPLLVFDLSGQDMIDVLEHALAYVENQVHPGNPGAQDAREDAEALGVALEEVRREREREWGTCGTCGGSGGGPELHLICRECGGEGRPLH